jgi:anaerobic selenocysteine-containing dehydrogenase
VQGRILHQQRFNTDDGKVHFVTRRTPQRQEKLLLTTVRSEGQFNTIVYERTDSYRNNADRWTVMLNKEDMQTNGLSDGDVTTLISAHGRMSDVTVREFNIALGSVMAYFPEANVLTGTEVDPRSKTPAFKSTAVWFERSESL